MVFFSVGEVLIIIGLLWLLMILFSKNIRRLTPSLLVIIFLIMTLNCFINYHCTPIAESFNAKADDGVEAGKDAARREFSVSELAELRDYIVDKCNELADKMPRNDAGEIIYDENAMKQEAKVSMETLGERFPKLSGFYVTPKQLFFSSLFSPQY